MIISDYISLIIHLNLFAIITYIAYTQISSSLEVRHSINVMVDWEISSAWLKIWALDSN